MKNAWSPEHPIYSWEPNTCLLLKVNFYYYVRKFALPNFGQGSQEQQWWFVSNNNIYFRKLKHLNNANFKFKEINW